MDLNKLNQIFAIFHSLNSDPKTELEYVNYFTLAVSVILSAQATDKSVNKATAPLFKIYNTPEAFLELGEENLKQYIKTIGLYNAKSKNLIALSQILVDKYNSELPQDFEELIRLPGIGRKSANVILNCAFSKLTMGVDTHVARVAERIGLTTEKKPEKIEKDLVAKIPEIWMKNAHRWLVLHGRYICKARKPECWRCPICQLCEYKYKNL